MVLGSTFHNGFLGFAAFAPSRFLQKSTGSHGVSCVCIPEGSERALVPPQLETELETHTENQILKGPGAQKAAWTLGSFQ